MKCLIVLLSCLLLILSLCNVFASENTIAVGEPQVIRLRVKKDEVFRYIVQAAITREARLQDSKDEFLYKIDDTLEFEVVQNCKSVEKNGDMVFEVSYGSFKLVRNRIEGSRSRKEVYTPESLTITDENGITITKKWTELPSSEQTELRKLFVQGFTLSVTPNGVIKESTEVSPFDRELPGFNSFRFQQIIYYHGQPMDEGTIWNWNKPFINPKLRDNPLSEKKIPAEFEYEFVELKDVAGIPCATISVKGKCDYADTEEKSSFNLELTEKAHVETANGMAVHVEGKIKSLLSFAGLSKAIVITTEGNFTIKRQSKKTE